MIPEKAACILMALFVSVLSGWAGNDQKQGIGAVIGTDQGVVLVKKVIPSTPADKAGLKEGDRITAIDGKSTRGLNLKQAQAQLAGLPDTTVKLLVESADGTMRTIEVGHGFVYAPARDIKDFAGTFIVDGQPDSPITIAVKDDGQLTIDFTSMHLKGIGIAYENSNFKTCHVKGVYQLQDHPKVDPKFRNLVGYFMLDQFSPGVLKLTTVWSLGTTQGKVEYFMARKTD